MRHQAVQQNCAIEMTKIVQLRKNSFFVVLSIWTKSCQNAFSFAHRADRSDSVILASAATASDRALQRWLFRYRGSAAGRARALRSRRRAGSRVRHFSPRHRASSARTARLAASSRSTTSSTSRRTRFAATKAEQIRALQRAQSPGHVRCPEKFAEKPLSLCRLAAEFRSIGAV